MHNNQFTNPSYNRRDGKTDEHTDGQTKRQTIRRTKKSTVKVPEVPPSTVVVGWRGVASINAPTPLVNQIAKRQERHLVQRHLEQEVDVTLYNKRCMYLCMFVLIVCLCYNLYRADNFQCCNLKIICVIIGGSWCRSHVEKQQNTWYKKL